MPTLIADVASVGHSFFNDLDTCSFRDFYLSKLRNYLSFICPWSLQNTVVYVVVATSMSKIDLGLNDFTIFWKCGLVNETEHKVVMRFQTVKWDFFTVPSSLSNGGFLSFKRSSSELFSKRANCSVCLGKKCFYRFSSIDSLLYNMS